MSELDRAASLGLVLATVAIVSALGLRVFRPRDFEEHAALFRAFVLMVAGGGLQWALEIQSSLPDSWLVVCRWVALAAQGVGTLWLCGLLIRYFVRGERRLRSERLAARQRIERGTTPY